MLARIIDRSMYSTQRQTYFEVCVFVSLFFPINSLTPNLHKISCLKHQRLAKWLVKCKDYHDMNLQMQVMKSAFAAFFCLTEKPF